MVAVTNDLMFELLKKSYNELGQMTVDLHEIKKRMTGTQETLSGVNPRLDRHDGRIEKRLELRELAEAQAGFDHNT